MQPQSTTGLAQAPGQGSPVRLTAPGQQQAFEAGGFWIRFVALIIDAIIMSIVKMPVVLVIGLITGLNSQSMVQGGALTGAYFGLQAINFLFSLVVTFVYCAWFYQSKGATPGKLLFGLRVVDATTGTYLSWGQTFMREIVGKVISGLTLTIGFLMAAFRPDKRALHDLLAGTQVLRVRK
jgi:uncharacterized RDD family membrane protein YckC